MRTRIASLALAGALAAGTFTAAAAGDGGHEQRWQVTVTNLTPAGSQPLSPPVAIVHSPRTDVWSPGQLATVPVAAIAEDANAAVAVQAYTALDGVRSVQVAPGGPVMPGESRTFTVASRGQFDRLSLLSMLVRTNDGFTGLDGLHLRGRGDSADVIAWDAGSERDNEQMASIPGFGHPFARDPEGAVITPHPGITGVPGGDVDPAAYGWPSGPVARITVTRDRG